MSIQEKLTRAHEQERILNTEMGKIDKQIRELIKRKHTLRHKISRNMKYRNTLIAKL
jgi:hypothetical protein